MLSYRQEATVLRLECISLTQVALQQLTADTALVHSITLDPSLQPELTLSTTAIHGVTDVTHRHSTVLVSFRLATHMSLEPPFQQPLPTEHRSTTMTTVTAT